MKKIFLSIFVFIFALEVKAQDDFFDSLIVDDEMKQKVEEKIEREDGKLKASEILDSKPIQLKIDESSKLKIEEKKIEEALPVVREPAPFGLKWLATVDEIEYLKIKLKPKKVKDSPNSYIAENLPKPVKAFREILVGFGDMDSLWRISGYGNFIEDDNKASKGLEEYKKFYDMLNEKYGNAQEFFTPAVLNVDEESTNENGEKTHKIKQKILDRGEDGFKEKLMSGETTLYSTFENDHIGVTLALFANGNGETFIVIDYKNLTLNDVEREKIYDAL